MDSDAPPAMASPDLSDGDRHPDDVIEIPQHLLDTPSKTAFTRREREIQKRRSQPSGVLRLSLEIRLMIYKMLFEDILDQDCLDRTSCFPRPPILRTCRILNIEACELWQVHLDFAIQDASRRSSSIIESLERQRSQLSDVAERSKSSYEIRNAERRDERRDANLSVLGKVRSRLQPKANRLSGRVTRRPADLAWYKKLPKFKSSD
ncbi:hypothetical protein B0A48_11034 [Cryoendolithus antarcticus]|uniref:Uncharacterized protein n=1 Tax=Cryoendolithus antarcticus TaxID=1507870 RepID=A0A1V8SV44_9PEZI|nr:hypothetical protein B0A48_11034 [Cryoendolithus antarcticus]